MGLFQKLSKSAGLVSGMAERLDVDLSKRIETAPELETASFQKLVMRCATCEEQDACARLQEANPLLDEAPSYCRNRDVFRSS